MDQTTVDINRLEDSYKGYNGVSFKESGSDIQITSGSVIEIAGAIYKATSDETISGVGSLTSNSNAYIYLSVSGSTASPEYLNTPPTWDTAKQGWYSGSKRCVGGTIYTSVLVFEMLWKQGDAYENYIREKVYDIGDWDMSSTSSIPATDIITDIGNEYWMDVRYNIRSDDGLQGAQVEAYKDNTIYLSGGNILTAKLFKDTTTGSLFGYYAAWELQVEETLSPDTTNWDSTSYNRGQIYLKYFTRLIV
jgi:hypothetical protein